MEEKIKYDLDAIEYIAKIADGGMRDAITLMDKCLSYSAELTMDNVIKALGVTDYEKLFKLNENFFKKDIKSIIAEVNEIYYSGLDLKLFIKSFFEFNLDVCMYRISKDLSNTKIPGTWKDTLDKYSGADYDFSEYLMVKLSELQSAIKWEQNPKPVIIAKFIMYIKEA